MHVIKLIYKVNLIKKSAYWGIVYCIMQYYVKAEVYEKKIFKNYW